MRNHKTSKISLLLSRWSVAILWTWYHVQSINTNFVMWVGMSQVTEPLPPSLTPATVNSSATSNLLSARYSWRLMAEMLGKTNAVYNDTENLQFTYKLLLCSRAFQNYSIKTSDIGRFSKLVYRHCLISNLMIKHYVGPWVYSDCWKSLVCITGIIT